MGGYYYQDPRPYYDLNNHNLISMDELFYGRKEPPPWYLQQQYGNYDQHRSRSMEPQGHHYDQQRSRSLEPQRPGGHYVSEDQFRRPDMRQDVYMDYPYGMQGHHNMQGYNMQGGHNMQGHHNMQGGHNHGQQQQQQQKGNNNNHGNNNHGGNNNNNHGNNNHGGNNNNKAKNQQKHQNDSDDEDTGRSHKGGNNHGNNHGNKGGHNNNHNNSSHHGHNNSWSDNRGFHGGRSHRRSLSLTQTVLKKLGFRDSSSDESSDDERYTNRKNTKGGHGHGQTKSSDHKPYTVRFDDQFYSHSNKGSHQKLGEDHGSHGKKGGGNGGGQPQGILKTSKNKHGDDSSDEENRGNQSKNKGGNNGNSGNINNNNKQGKQLGRSQSMDFRVNLCCDNCERKVKKALRKLDVDQVICDQFNNRVMVTGNAKPESILKKLKSVKRDTLMWHSHK